MNLRTIIKPTIFGRLRRSGRVVQIAQTVDNPLFYVDNYPSLLINRADWQSSRKGCPPYMACLIHLVQDMDFVSRKLSPVDGLWMNSSGIHPQKKKPV
jgi:hypothetical protein